MCISFFNITLLFYFQQFLKFEFSKFSVLVFLWNIRFSFFTFIVILHAGPHYIINILVYYIVSIRTFDTFNLVIQINVLM